MLCVCMFHVNHLAIMSIYNEGMVKGDDEDDEDDGLIFQKMINFKHKDKVQR